MCGVYITRPLYPVVGVGAVGAGVGLQSQVHCGSIPASPVAMVTKNVSFSFFHV